jgi:hypothetical protein
VDRDRGDGMESAGRLNVVERVFDGLAHFARRERALTVRRGPAGRLRPASSSVYSAARIARRNAALDCADRLARPLPAMSAPSHDRLVEIDLAADRRRRQHAERAAIEAA